MLYFHLTDIDECSSNPCENDGTCTDGVNMYTCSCVAGYNGDNCEISKVSVLNLADRFKDIKVTECLENNLISTNKIKRIKVPNS